MPYILRLNGDPDIQVNVEHVETFGSSVEIKDKAVFPPGTFKEYTQLFMAELLDENGKLYAMRRLPTHIAPVVNAAMQLEFNWILHVCQNPQ